MSCIKLTSLSLLVLLVVPGTNAAGGGGLWLSGGQDGSNNRHQKTEKIISPANVNQLSVKWQFNTAGEVSATPAVDGSMAYFPDFAGNLYALNRETGAVVWHRAIADYVDNALPAVPATDFSRSTPAVAGSLLIFGDQGGRAALESGQPFATGSARVRAVNKHTGELVWSTQVDEHYAAIVTASISVHGNIAFVGVASYEEAYAGFIPSQFYQCCTFRGSVVALNVNTGAILWKTYMAPKVSPATGPDYSGNAVWGSTPATDPKRRAVYVATGNNYSIPDSVSACIIAAASDGNAQRACLPADNFLDAVVSLNMDTGAVNWSTTVIPFDTWNVGCLDIGLPVDPEHCPDPQGPDFDFGQAPMLYSVGTGKNKRDLLGIGQKSGQFWSLDADSGEIVWTTQGGIGGVAGGFIWGSATDGARLYGAEANSFAALWTLSNGQQTNSGGWVAMDPASGAILWQKANPVPFGPAGGAVSVANGVLFGCAQSSFIPGASGPNMFAMNSATGNMLWSFDSVGACNAGAAIVDGTVYWGFGYPGDRGPGGFGLIAFGLNN